MPITITRTIAGVLLCSMAALLFGCPPKPQKVNVPDLAGMTQEDAETALVAAEYGLEVRLYLGAWWQDQVPDVPVPLGVIAARQALGPDVLGALARALRQSLLATRADPALTTPLARLLAREKRSEVIAAHIRAYVGDLSLDMGEAGTKALGILAALSNRGQFPTGSLLPASDQSC